MTVLDTVRRRYTAKHYDAAKRISDTDFTELLEVLRLSPTSVNAQATKFFIADTPEAKAKIAPAFWDFNQPRVTDASHVVVFAVPTVVTDEHLKAVLQKEDADGRFPSEELKKQQDAGRRRCVELFSETPGGTFAWSTEKLDEILGLADKGLRSICAVSLGYRTDNDGNAARPKSRLAADQVFTRL